MDPHLSPCPRCAQVHRRVPVSLMLGVSTSPTALEALLPLQAVAALRPHQFHLTPAIARAESLYSEARLWLRFLLCIPSLQSTNPLLC